MIRSSLILLLPRGKRSGKSDVHHGVHLEALLLVFVRKVHLEVRSSESDELVIDPRGDGILAGLVDGDHKLIVAIELDENGKDLQVLNFQEVGDIRTL